MSVIFTILPVAMLLTEHGPTLCCSVEVLSFEAAGQAMDSFCLILAVCFGEKEQDTNTVDDESLIQQKHMSLVNVCLCTDGGFCLELTICFLACLNRLGS